MCVLDVMMPKMDGFILASEIRKTDDCNPIIFLTAKALTEDRIKGFKLGTDDYVTQPFSKEELALKVKVILKRGIGIFDTIEKSTYSKRIQYPMSFRQKKHVNETRIHFKNYLGR
ncbi:MAG: two-component system response regulator VicR [Salibacteraceae bacterium]|jgi:DNA-binding response OmpR family regulator